MGGAAPGLAERDWEVVAGGDPVAVVREAVGSAGSLVERLQGAGQCWLCPHPQEQQDTDVDTDILNRVALVDEYDIEDDGNEESRNEEKDQEYYLVQL